MNRFRVPFRWYTRCHSVPPVRGNSLDGRTHLPSRNELEVCRTWRTLRIVLRLDRSRVTDPPLREWHELISARDLGDTPLFLLPGLEPPAVDVSIWRTVREMLRQLQLAPPVSARNWSEAESSGSMRPGPSCTPKAIYRLRFLLAASSLRSWPGRCGQATSGPGTPVGHDAAALRFIKDNSTTSSTNRSALWQRSGGKTSADSRSEVLPALKQREL